MSNPIQNRGYFTNDRLKVSFVKSTTYPAQVHVIIPGFKRLKPKHNILSIPHKLLLANILPSGMSVT